MQLPARIGQRLLAGLALALACWVAIGTPVRPLQSDPYHLHADGSARPLEAHHPPHEEVQPAVDWAHAPLVAMARAGDFVNAILPGPVLLGLGAAALPIAMAAVHAASRAGPSLFHPPRGASLP